MTLWTIVLPRLRPVAEVDPICLTIPDRAYIVVCDTLASEPGSDPMFGRPGSADIQ